MIMPPPHKGISEFGNSERLTTHMDPSFLHDLHAKKQYLSLSHNALNLESTHQKYRHYSSPISGNALILLINEQKDKVTQTTNCAD